MQRERERNIAWECIHVLWLIRTRKNNEFLSNNVRRESLPNSYAVYQILFPLSIGWIVWNNGRLSVVRFFLSPLYRCRHRPRTTPPNHSSTVVVGQPNENGSAKGKWARDREGGMDTKLHKLTNANSYLEIKCYTHKSNLTRNLDTLGHSFLFAHRLRVCSRVFPNKIKT